MKFSTFHGHEALIRNVPDPTSEHSKQCDHETSFRRIKWNFIVQTMHQFGRWENVCYTDLRREGELSKWPMVCQSEVWKGDGKAASR